jgi:hypothetical protein
MSPEWNHSPSKEDAASGRFQYCLMTFGPERRISPCSPGPTSCPAGSTIFTSLKKCGSPEEPAFSRDFAAGRLVAPGEVSVIP